MRSTCTALMARHEVLTVQLMSVDSFAGSDQATSQLVMPKKKPWGVAAVCLQQALSGKALCVLQAYYHNSHCAAQLVCR